MHVNLLEESSSTLLLRFTDAFATRTCCSQLKLLCKNYFFEGAGILLTNYSMPHVTAMTVARLLDVPFRMRQSHPRQTVKQRTPYISSHVVREQPSCYRTLKNPTPQLFPKVLGTRPSSVPARYEYRKDNRQDRKSKRNVFVLQGYSRGHSFGYLGKMQQF